MNCTSVIGKSQGTSDPESIIRKQQSDSGKLSPALVIDPHQQCNRLIADREKVITDKDNIIAELKDKLEQKSLERHQLELSLRQTIVELSKDNEVLMENLLNA